MRTLIALLVLALVLEGIVVHRMYVASVADHQRLIDACLPDPKECD